MPASRPNVLVILADDLGWFDLSCYHQGLMGGRTPNIDRIASAGARFTDFYAQASCTAGRAALITGQLPMRTGMTTVGLPGAPVGLQHEDPTLAELLKQEGYVTAQIGKNHLGDRNDFLPTVHGFDEFYGNLYHLNAEEEPEQPDYPIDHPIMQMFMPRGLLDCKATDVDDPTEDPRFGRVGRQAIEDTGPLTRKRMETIEDDLLGRSLDFIDRAHASDKPFFLWHNTTRMHVWTHLSDRWRDKTTFGLYADGLQELDWVVGELLDKLDSLGIADNTVVVFTTDNGAEKFSWPDGGTSPFRGEKGLGWEGGFRAPCVIRWTDHIPPGQVLNGIASLEDIVPTVMAAVGVPDIKEKLAEGHQAGDKTFRVHLDGYNQLPYLTGEVEESPRDELLLLRRARAVRTSLPELEGPLPGEGQLVRWAGENTDRPAAGQLARRSLRTAHGRALLPAVRRSEALDRAARRRTSSRCTQRRSNGFRRARHRPTSAPKTRSRRCSTRPPAA